MKKKILLEKIKLLGYPLFEPDENPDVNETLAEVVKGKDLRLWEGFPLLLINSLEKGLFNHKAVEMYLENVFDKRYFYNLVIMSLALYEYLQLSFSLANKLRYSKIFDKRLFERFLKQFKQNKNLKDVKNLSSDRVVNAFKRYFKQRESDLEIYTQMKDKFDLEYSLSQIFSKKQKELFMKRLKNEKMTKTEREYYSRSVRKKVLALANSDLHKLAVELVKH